MSLPWPIAVRKRLRRRSLLQLARRHPCRDWWALTEATAPLLPVPLAWQVLLADTSHAVPASTLAREDLARRMARYTPCGWLEASARARGRCLSGWLFVDDGLSAQRAAVARLLRDPHLDCPAAWCPADGSDPVLVAAWIAAAAQEP